MTSYRDRFKDSDRVKLSAKDQEEKQKLFYSKGNTFIDSESASRTLTEVESERFIKQYIKEQTRYIPEIDYNDPSTFCFFGSAERYYVDSVDRVCNTYPYDGSQAEKLEWFLSSSYLDLYLFEHKHPKSTGFVTFGSYSSATGSYTSGSGGNITRYGSGSSAQYIYFTGGPHKNTLYSAAKGRENNLKIDATTGNTVEFWMKKSGVASLTQREVITDIYTPGVIDGSNAYGRLTFEFVNTTADSGSPFRITVLSGSTGANDLPIGNLTRSSVHDNIWHHYAITVNSTKTNAGSDITYYKLYVDGVLNHTVSENYKIGPVDRHFVGTIGALASAASVTSTGKAGFGALGAGMLLNTSLDEFRFWKTARTEKEIGRNWFYPVHGGTGGQAGDHANSKLGLYYKFNEGITLTSSYDSIVLDYSGRVNNGSVINWNSNFRNAGSAIDSSPNVKDESYTEPKDPIINEFNSSVVAHRQEYKNKGLSHDRQNMNSLLNTVPGFLRESDQDLFPELIQVISFALDDIFLKIKFLPKMKNYNFNDFFNKKGVLKDTTFNNYTLGCVDETSDFEFVGNREKPWIADILEHYGLLTTEIFPNAEIYEFFYNRSEEVVFEQKLQEIKNTILSNIHKNLIHIYNTKGTLDSYRNLIRCFGVDDELLSLNVYSNNETRYIQNNSYPTVLRKKSLSYADDGSHFTATLYPSASLTSAEEKAFFTGSSASPKYPFTLEANVLFPDKKIFETPIKDASLFGMHSVRGTRDKNDLAWTDTGFKVYAQKINAFSDSVRFILTGSNTIFGESISLSSSYFPKVYDNKHWHISARIGKRNQSDFNAISYGASGAAATATIRFDAGSIAGYDNKKIILTNTAGVTKTYIFDSTNSEGATGTVDGSGFIVIQLHGLNFNKAGITAQFETAVEHENGHNGTIVVQSDGEDPPSLTMTQQTAGASGNTTISNPDDINGIALNGVSNEASSKFTGGLTADQYLVEFSGSHYDLDYKRHSFYLTSSISKAAFEGLSTSNKSVFFGAHRTNFSGSTVMSTDCKLLSFNAWKDRLTGPELDLHAQNPNLYGRQDPQRITPHDSGQNVLMGDTLLVRWQFENLTASAAETKPAPIGATSTVRVVDYASGSLDRNYKLSEVLAYKYPGIGIGFSKQQKAINQEFLSVVDFNNIDNYYTNDKVKIKTAEIDLFKRESRPITYFYSFEKSMYQTISKEMLSFFSGMVGFNNIIGEPVNKYRDEYKALSKLRERFFSKVENDLDLERYVDYYKWIDSSLSHFLKQLIPASSEFSTRVSEIVESHMLERNKYQHKAPTIEFKNAPKIWPIKGINELLYDWEFGHAPFDVTTPATATIVISDAGGIQNSDTFVLVDSFGQSTTYTINGGIESSAGGGSGGSATVGFLIDGDPVGGGTAGKVRAATAITAAINATTDASYTAVSDGVDTVTITQNHHGSVGNRINIDNIGSTTVSNFTGGTGFEESDNCLWWSERLARDNPIFNTSANNGDKYKYDTVKKSREAIRKASITDLSGSTYALRSFAKPYKLTMDWLNVISENHNRKANKIQDLYKTVNDGNKIQLTSGNIYEFKNCDDILKPNQKSRWTAKIDVIGEDGYIDGDADLLLPFNLLSSSVENNFPDLKQGIHITNNLHDGFEGSLQSGYPETHVGGMPHRHVPLTTMSDLDALEDGKYFRPEAYEIIAGNNIITIQSASIDSPKSMFYRDHGVRQPYSIKNIKFDTGSFTLGNYSRDYEIVMTNGRSNNNPDFVESGGYEITQNNTSLLAEVTHFEVRNRKRKAHVIVNKFSAPGSPESMSPWGLEPYGGEYSISNTLNYRNRSVRNVLDKLYSQPSERYGLRPMYASAEIDFLNNNTLAIVGGFSYITISSSTGRAVQFSSHIQGTQGQNFSKFRYTFYGNVASKLVQAKNFTEAFNNSPLSKEMVAVSSSDGKVNLYQTIPGTIGTTKIETNISSTNATIPKSFTGGGEPQYDNNGKQTNPGSIHQTNRNTFVKLSLDLSGSNKFRHYPSGDAPHTNTVTNYNSFFGEPRLALPSSSVGPSGEFEYGTKQIKDNFYIQRPIPAASLNYSWINKETDLSPGEFLIKNSGYNYQNDYYHTSSFLIYSSSFQDMALGQVPSDSWITNYTADLGVDGGETAGPRTAFYTLTASNDQRLGNTILALTGTVVTQSPSTSEPGNPFGFPVGPQSSARYYRWVSLKEPITTPLAHVKYEVVAGKGSSNYTLDPPEDGESEDLWLQWKIGSDTPWVQNQIIARHSVNGDNTGGVNDPIAHNDGLLHKKEYHISKGQSAQQPLYLRWISRAHSTSTAHDHWGIDSVVVTGITTRKHTPLRHKAIDANKEISPLKEHVSKTSFHGLDASGSWMVSQEHGGKTYNDMSIGIYKRINNRWKKVQEITQEEAGVRNLNRTDEDGRFTPTGYSFTLPYQPSAENFGHSLKLLSDYLFIGAPGKLEAHGQYKTSVSDKQGLWLATEGYALNEHFDNHIYVYRLNRDTQKWEYLQQLEASKDNPSGSAVYEANGFCLDAVDTRNYRYDYIDGVRTKVLDKNNPGNIYLFSGAPRARHWRSAKPNRSFGGSGIGSRLSSKCASPRGYGAVNVYRLSTVMSGSKHNTQTKAHFGTAVNDQANFSVDTRYPGQFEKYPFLSINPLNADHYGGKNTWDDRLTGSAYDEFSDSFYGWSGSLFGYSLSVNKDAYLLVGAPGYRYGQPSHQALGAAVGGAWLFKPMSGSWTGGAGAAGTGGPTIAEQNVTPEMWMPCGDFRIRNGQTHDMDFAPISGYEEHRPWNNGVRSAQSKGRVMMPNAHSASMGYSTLITDDELFIGCPGRTMIIHGKKNHDMFNTANSPDGWPTKLANCTIMGPPVDYDYWQNHYRPSVNQNYTWPVLSSSFLGFGASLDYYKDPKGRGNLFIGCPQIHLTASHGLLAAGFNIDWPWYTRAQVNDFGYYTQHGQLVTKDNAESIGGLQAGLTWAGRRASGFVLLYQSQSVRTTDDWDWQVPASDSVGEYPGVAAITFLDTLASNASIQITDSEGVARTYNAADENDPSNREFLRTIGNQAAGLALAIAQDSDHSDTIATSVDGNVILLKNTNKGDAAGIKFTTANVSSDKAILSARATEGHNYVYKDVFNAYPHRGKTWIPNPQDFRFSQLFQTSRVPYRWSYDINEEYEWVVNEFGKNIAVTDDGILAVTAPSDRDHDATGYYDISIYSGSYLTHLWKNFHNSSQLSASWDSVGFNETARNRTYSGSLYTYDVESLRAQGRTYSGKYNYDNWTHSYLTAAARQPFTVAGKANSVKKYITLDTDSNTINFDSSSFYIESADNVGTYISKNIGNSWNSWKQLRASDNPVSRYHRKNNLFSFVYREVGQVGIKQDGEPLLYNTRKVPNVSSQKPSYEFDTGPDNYILGDADKATRRGVSDRKVISFKESPISNTPTQLAATFYNGDIRSFVFEDIRNEKPYLSQREQALMWRRDFSGYSFLEGDIVNLDSRPRVALSLTMTLNNDFDLFSSPEIKNFLDIEEKQDAGPLAVLGRLRTDSINNRAGNNDGADQGLEINYVETIYPKNVNMYSKEVREREKFDFFPWKNDTEKRKKILTGSVKYSNYFGIEANLGGGDSITAFRRYTDNYNYKNYKESNSFGVDAVDSAASRYYGESSFDSLKFITASTWILDSRSDFATRPVNITDSYFKYGHQFQSIRTQGTRGEGLLQNDYNIFALGINTLHGTPPLAPIYSRRVVQKSGSQEYLAGEAKWEAAEQFGRGPFVDGYAEYCESIKAVGKDHSIVPEFRISEFIEDVIRSRRQDPTSISKFFSLTGSTYDIETEDVSVGTQFFKTYSQTEMLKHFSFIKGGIEGHTTVNQGDLEASRITMKCNAVMKFLPYKGFYPAERATELASLFARSYLPGPYDENNYGLSDENIEFTADQTLAILTAYFDYGGTDHSVTLPARHLLGVKVRANLQQTFKAFFAPGILFNSIKSGLAVDYPIWPVDYSEVDNLVVGSPIRSFANSTGYPTNITGSILNNSHKSYKTLYYYDFKDDELGKLPFAWSGKKGKGRWTANNTDNVLVHATGSETDADSPSHDSGDPTQSPVTFGGAGSQAPNYVGADRILALRGTREIISTVADRPIAGLSGYRWVAYSGSNDITQQKVRVSFQLKVGHHHCPFGLETPEHAENEDFFLQYRTRPGNSNWQNAARYSGDASRSTDGIAHNDNGYYQKHVVVTKTDQDSHFEFRWIAHPQGDLIAQDNWGIRNVRIEAEGLSVPALSSSSNTVVERITFENLLRPETIYGLSIYDSEPHPSASLWYGNSATEAVIERPFKLGLLDEDHNRIKLGVKNFTTSKEGFAMEMTPYKLAIDNFCAETVNFFLQDGKFSTLESKKVNPVLEKDKEYKMRVYLRNSNLQMYDRPSAFGPAVSEGRPTITKQKFVDVDKEATNSTLELVFEDSRLGNSTSNVQGSLVGAPPGGHGVALGLGDKLSAYVPSGSTVATIPGFKVDLGAGKYTVTVRYYQSASAGGDPGVTESTLTTYGATKYDLPGLLVDDAAAGTQMFHRTGDGSKGQGPDYDLNLFAGGLGYFFAKHDEENKTHEVFIPMPGNIFEDEDTYSPTRGETRARLSSEDLAWYTATCLNVNVDATGMDSYGEEVTATFKYNMSATTGLSASVGELYSGWFTSNYSIMKRNLKRTVVLHGLTSGVQGGPNVVAQDLFTGQNSGTSSPSQYFFSGDQRPGKAEARHRLVQNDPNAVITSSDFNYLTAVFERRRDTAFRGGAPASTNKELRAITVNDESHGYRPFTPPFLPINSEPYAEFTIDTGAQPGVATIEVTSATSSHYDSKELILTDSSGKTVVYFFDDDGDAATGTLSATGRVTIQIQSLSSVTAIAREIKRAILSTNGHGNTPLGGFGVKQDGGVLTLTQAIKGVAGNTIIENPELIPGLKTQGVLNVERGLFTGGRDGQEELHKNYTLDELWQFGEFKYYNFDKDPSNVGNNPNYHHAMSISASLDLKTRVRFNDGNANEGADARATRDRWVIQPKWETPILNFRNVERSVLNLETNTVEKISNSSYENRNAWKDYYNNIAPEEDQDIPLLTASCGMWHQSGSIPKPADGYALSVEDVPGLPEDQQLGVLLGFNRPADQRIISTNFRKKSIGRIAKTNTVSEAVVAMPIYVTPGSDTINYFNIGDDLIEQAEAFVNAEHIHQPGEPGVNKIANIAYQIECMKKYVFPPSFDFINFNHEVKPLMYVFQFHAEFIQEDLAAIWQNIYPESGNSTALPRSNDPAVNTRLNIKQDISYVSHHLGDAFTPYERIQEKPFQNATEHEVRWIVFKVKQRAKQTIGQVKLSSLSEPVGNIEETNIQNPNQEILSLYSHGFNWPYDYFSIVELIKLETKIDFIS